MTRAPDVLMETRRTDLKPLAGRYPTRISLSLQRLFNTHDFNLLFFSSHMFHRDDARASTNHHMETLCKVNLKLIPNHTQIILWSLPYECLDLPLQDQNIAASEGILFSRGKDQFLLRNSCGYGHTLMAMVALVGCGLRYTNGHGCT